MGLPREVATARLVRSSMIQKVQATRSWIGEQWLEGVVNEELALRASGSGVTARGPAVLTLRPAPENLRVRIPLRIEVLDRFDANVDLDLRFTIAARGGAPGVWLYQFVADIGWVDWATPLALPGVESVLRTMLRAFLGQALEHRLQTALGEGLRLFCSPNDELELCAMWIDEQAVQFHCEPATALLSVTLRAFPEIRLDGREIVRDALLELALN